MTRVISAARAPSLSATPAMRAAAAGSVVVAVSVFVGWGIAFQRHLTPIYALTLLALVAIYLSVRPDLLFLGWVFVAPFLQNSARHSHFGSVLVLVLYVLPIGIFVLQMLVRSGVWRRSGWYDALPAAYVIFVIASQGVVHGSDLMSTGFYGSLVNSGILVGVPLYYFCAFGPLNRLSKDRAAAALLAGSSAVAAMAIAEHYTKWNLWGEEFVSTPRRVIATLSSPAVLGAFLGVGAVVAIAVLVWDGPRKLRTLSIVTLASTIPALYFTYTRGGMVATAVVAAVLVAARPRQRVLGLGIAAVVGAILAANWGAISSSNIYQQRLQDTQNVQGRLLLSKGSLDLAAQRPLVGWGYGTYNAVRGNVSLNSGDLSPEFFYMYTSHDTFLTILVELGAVGFALFLLPWAIVIWRSVRSLPRAAADGRWFTFAALGTFGVYVLTALTIDMRFFSFVPALPWIAVGLLRRDLADEA